MVNLCAGDWVEVKSKEEILKTLDEQGQLDGMPFMPEMFAFCGRRFRVHKRAHKTCDTVFPVRGRRVTSSVHLETRCDGSAHGGCQAGCLLFWKDAWLKRVDDKSEHPASRPAGDTLAPKGCTEKDVYRATRTAAASENEEPVYVCQATRLPYFTEDLSPYEFRQYIEDYTSGNVGLGTLLKGLSYITYQNLINRSRGMEGFLQSLYERFQRLRGGLPYPRRRGPIPIGQPTPTEHLDLKEGEWVRVKSYQEILATCTVDNKNRGMLFDAEMMPFCGKVFRVHKRVTQILNEQTGKMMKMKNPCIILENVVCEASYSECRMFCPREIYSYWREIWLERVPAPTQSEANAGRELNPGTTPSNLQPTGF
jgi:hypothetical protein